MTVSSTTNRKSFTGDDVTVAFGTSPVVFFDDTDLEVYLVTTATGASVLQTLTTDYTVSGGAGSTGTVTMVTAPASTETLVILRVLPFTQTDDFVNNDINDAEVLEDRLDKLTMVDQQIDEETGRALRVPASEGEQADIAVAGRAGYYLRRNVAGDAFELVVGDPSTTTFTQSGTGAVSRSLTSKVAESVTPEDFGAVGDGVTDDAGPLQLALNHCATNNKNLNLISRYMSSARLVVSSTQAFSVYGSGSDAVALLFNTKTDCGLELIAANSQESGPWAVFGFGLYAATPQLNDTALEVGYLVADTQSEGPFISVSVQYDPRLGATNGSWLKGIELVNAGSATIHKPYLYGRANNNQGNAILMTGDCTPGPKIIGPYIYNWDRGITKGEAVTDITEGTSIIEPNIVAVNYGVYFDNSVDGGQPGVNVTGGHISSNTCGVLGIETNQISINGVLFYRRSGGTGTYNDISLTDVTSFRIMGNNAGNPGTSGTQTFATIATSTAGVISANVIQGNRDVGVALDATSQVVVTDDNNFAAATTEATRGNVSGDLGNVFMKGLSIPTTLYGGYKFDGTLYLRGNALTGITDTKTGAFVWQGRFANASGSQEVLVDSTGISFRVIRNAEGEFRVSAKNSGSTTILDIVTTGAPLASSGKYTIFATWNLASAGTARVWINDQPCAVTETTYTNDTIDYTVTNYYIGASTTGTLGFTGDLYSIWFSELPTGLQVENSRSRRAFFDTNNLPVFMGWNGELPTNTNFTPILFHAYDDYARWPAQRGAAQSTAWIEDGTPGAVTTTIQGQYMPLSPRAGIVTVTGNYTVQRLDYLIKNNRAATNTLTLPDASTCKGRVLRIKTIQAQAVVSASSDVEPQIGGALGTAILAAVDGSWADLQSDGVGWVITAS